MSGRKNRIIDGEEYCNCVNCESTERRCPPPDSYALGGHPVYGSNCLTHFRPCEDSDETNND